MSSNKQGGEEVALATSGLMIDDIVGNMGTARVVSDPLHNLNSFETNVGTTTRLKEKRKKVVSVAKVPPKVPGGAVAGSASKVHKGAVKRANDRYSKLI